MTEFLNIVNKKLKKKLTLPEIYSALYYYGKIKRKRRFVQVRHKSNELLEKQILTLWKKGKRIREIARELGIGVWRVYDVLENKGGYKKKRKKRGGVMVTDDVVRAFCAILKATGKQWLAGLVTGISLGITTRIKKFCNDMVPENYREVAAKEMALAGIRRDIIEKYTDVSDNLPLPDSKRVRRTLEALGGYVKTIPGAEKYISPNAKKLMVEAWT